MFGLEDNEHEFFVVVFHVEAEVGICDWCFVFLEEVVHCGCWLRDEVDVEEVFSFLICICCNFVELNAA